MAEKITAIIGIRIRDGRLNEVEKALVERDEIKSAHLVTGGYDMMALGEFDGRPGLENFIKEVLRWRYIERTNTFVSLRQIKKTG